MKAFGAASQFSTFRRHRCPTRCARRACLLLTTPRNCESCQIPCPAQPSRPQRSAGRAAPFFFGWLGALLAFGLRKWTWCCLLCFVALARPSMFSVQRLDGRTAGAANPIRPFAPHHGQGGESVQGARGRRSARSVARGIKGDRRWIEHRPKGDASRWRRLIAPPRLSGGSAGPPQRDDFGTWPLKRQKKPPKMEAGIIFDACCQSPTRCCFAGFVVLLFCCSV